jgi:sugar (pentulose or hexulose) kinase
MSAIPVIAIFDVGKTNKKLFLFDENYNIVFEKSAQFTEITDEDGFPCENLENLRRSVFESLNEVSRKKEFEIKAINFSAYGASFVCLDKNGKTLTPLYNYLKPYPAELSKELYEKYNGEKNFCLQTASPPLGSLNSGLQLYRLKRENPEIFKKIKYALHLPQYMSFILTGKYLSDLTSIGCHTGLWDFEKKTYHQWVKQEGIASKLAPIEHSDCTSRVLVNGSAYNVGISIHDSSAALIPYQTNFTTPFLLLSTGTWCISLNPFNQTPLTADELKKDCLQYLDYRGKPVKASRLFLGPEYEHQIKRIAAHFNIDTIKYRNLVFDPEIASSVKMGFNPMGTDHDLSSFENDITAYYQIVADLIRAQYESTQLVLAGTGVRKLLVDGGFSKNTVFMHLLAAAFPDMEVYAASMAQASALGSALAIHTCWNTKPIPTDIVKLKYYPAANTILSR